MKYQIEVLSPKEFEKVAKSDSRYSRVLDEDNPSLGFTDVKKGKAYIVKTHWPEVNKALLSHEFEHLLEEHATDEDENGIRHKKFFKQIFAPYIAPILGGILGGPLLGGLLGGGLFGSSLGAGIGAGAFRGLSGVAAGERGVGRSALIAGGTAAGTSAVAGGLGRFFSGAQPASQVAAGGASAPAGSVASAPGQAAGALSRFRSPLVGNFLQQTQGVAALPGGPLTGPSTASIAPQLLRGVQNQPTTPQSSVVAPQLQAPAAPPTPPPGTTPQLPATQAPQAAQPPQGALEKFKAAFTSPAAINSLVGAGVSGIGDLLSPQQELPDVNSLGSVQRFRDSLGRPLSELGSLAQSRLNERLSQGFGGLNTDIESGMRRQFEERRRQTASQFKLFRPNADLATDSAFRQAMGEIDQLEAESIARAQQQELSRFENRQTSDISTALGIDESQLSQLVQLANLDIAQLMQEYNMNRQEAQEFKDIFSNLGSGIASGGFQSGGTQ